MLYLLDANVLITASNTYYPFDQIPEFWEWLSHMGKLNHVKIPQEMMEEIKEGRDEKHDNQLYNWLHTTSVLDALLFDEEPDIEIVQKVVNEGYASDLTDDEIEQVGRDPFLIAYAIKESSRCVVTTEVSKPKAKRQNKHIPDVCKTLNVKCCNTFQLNAELGFKTSWREKY